MGGTHTINAQIPEKFIGSWDFIAHADHGYETGIIEVKKDSVITSLTGSSYKYRSDWVKYESDTLKFKFFSELAGSDVQCYFIVDDASNLNGYAYWSMGESKLILTRSKVKE